MKVLRPLLLFALALVVVAALAAQSKPTYTVGTVKEFLQRIGPNRTILLKKGDYKLWTAYDQTGSNFGWLDGDDGKELTIDKTDNLTLRGADGARIVTNSASSYLMGFYGSAKLEIDNIAFARELASDTNADAGLVYVESVTSLSLSRIKLSGPGGNPLELWDCASVELKDFRIEGASNGAMSLGKIGALKATGGTVSKVEGFPLIYVEEGGKLDFNGTSFADNSGGNFVEIYPGEGDPAELGFTKCSFARNQFDYFVGNKNLPTTTDCSFAGSSFDEAWADNSVNLVTDESYGDYSAPDNLGYSDEESGLGFSYPAAWGDYKEGAAPGRVSVSAPDSNSIVFFMKVMDITTSFDQVKDGEKLLAKSLVALNTILKNEGKMTMKVSPAGQMYDWEEWKQKEYTGTIALDSGTPASARLRLTLLPKGVWAILAASNDASALEDGGEIETVLSSLSSSSGGE